MYVGSGYITVKMGTYALPDIAKCTCLLFNYKTHGGVPCGQKNGVCKLCEYINRNNNVAIFTYS